MIKKSVFLIGLLMLLGPIWLASRFTTDSALIDQMNQDIAQYPSASGTDAPFSVFDATQYQSDIYPWMGFPITVIYEDELLGRGDNIHQPPNEFRIKEVLLNHKSDQRIILKIDSWNPASAANEFDAKRYVDWMVMVLAWSHEVLPKANIGYFGLPTSLWFALQKPVSRIIDYQNSLRRLDPVLRASDSLYPDFIVRYGETDHLFYSMISQIYISRSYGKKVYPILWQRGNINRSGKHDILPIDLLLKQCDFVKKYADGVVWWSEAGEVWKDGWYDKVKHICFE